VKQLLIRLANLFGVVPASRYKSLVNQLDEARNSAQAWKSRAGDALARVKSLEGDLKRHERLIKEARVAAEKAHHQRGEATKLQEQLAETERELMLAREHLMAIEVKLDILEGAANVLDARTRSAVRHHPTGTGAAV
jgi:chromosome segregation ATPase